MAITVNKGYQDAQIINESPRSTYIYKDLNLFFTKHPISSDVSKVTDVQAIKRSIRNLVLTKQGERLFHPEIGGNVHAALFEIFTPIVKVELENSIADVISLYEPRAVVSDIVIDEDTAGHGGAKTYNMDANRLNVSIYFYLLNTPNEIHQVDVLLERVR